MGKRRKPAKLIADPDALIFSGGEDSDDDFKKHMSMGFLCMEEITGEEAKKMLEEARRMPGKFEEKAKESEPAKKKAKKAKTKATLVEPEVPGEEVVLNKGDLPTWRKYPLDERLLLGLKKLKFLKPTPVQEKSLDSFYSDANGTDILGSAPTGSGKTLAFGLPILNHVLRNENGLSAFIIAPTRELALQIRDHLTAVCAGSFKLRLATLIGGMSSEKQDRQLASNPQVIVGTPGRLLECIEGDAALQKSVAQLPFLVIDEADRLVESGHFKELDSILASVYAYSTWKDRRTFLFSATLDFEPAKEKAKAHHKKIKSSLEQLRAKIKFCSPTPAHISVGAKSGLATGLTLSKIYALPDEKDLFLVYFLLSNRNFAKALLFVNSIDILKRVQPVLEVFDIPTTSLHAQMQQRQRLQHLDKFRAAPNMILVTSDVSARGLDIPAVDLVVHYHLPSSVDTFVHRCGRTARAQRQGSSMALIAPQEVVLEKAINKKLALPSGIPEASIDLAAVDGMRQLVDLARQIETLQSRINKACKEQTWEAKAAAELGLDLDDDIGKGRKQQKKKMKGEDEDESHMKREKTKLAALKSSFTELRKALRI